MAGYDCGEEDHSKVKLRCGRADVVQLRDR